MTEDMTTRPTIETVLERINALEQKIEGRIDGLDTRMGGVEHQVNGLRSELVNIRSDTNVGFRQVARKIEVLNDNILAVQATHRDLIVRVENLESQGS